MFRMADMTMSEFKETVKSFKSDFPELLCRGVSYEMYGFRSIKVYIPRKGKMIYDSFHHTAKWIEHWEDERDAKRREREMRPDMYNRFCENIELYLRTHSMTHQQFADMVGISRQSLSRYLNGDSIPKVSTMKRICKTIHIDI